MEQARRDMSQEGHKVGDIDRDTYLVGAYEEEVDTCKVSNKDGEDSIRTSFWDLVIGLVFLSWDDSSSCFIDNLLRFILLCVHIF